MQIIDGAIQSAQKVVVYGPEGIGKSTFASMFPNPIFIDTEGSTKKLSVKRFERPTSWEMLISQVQYVKSNYKILNCSTLVIDTADWAERLCSTHVCAKAKKNGIEDFGYGKGYTYLAEEFGKLPNLCEDLVELGINVVITAHAQMRKFEQPDEMGSYDRWELKLTKYVSPIIKEWADTLLFANYQTNVVKVDDKKYKAQGGTKRIMYTTHNACYDAKNRDNLPEMLPFEYGAIKSTIYDRLSAEPAVTEDNGIKEYNFKNTPPATQKATADELINDLDKMVDTAPRREPEPIRQITDELPDYIPKPLADLMKANDVSEAEIQEVVAQREYYPQDTPIAKYDSDFIDGCLVGAWNKMYPLIVSNRDLPI